MKKNSIIITILIFFSVLSGQQVPLTKNQLIKKHTYSNKISPLLAIQLDLKRSYIAAPQKYSLRNFINRDMQVEAPEQQRVYLYFSEYPDNTLIAELESYGGELKQDSWIPPVGHHPFGFLLAVFPVSQVNLLANIDHIYKIDTAERYFYPNNNKAAVDIKSEILWPLEYNGSGVRLAVLDSGLDTDHPDFPTPIVALDYSSNPENPDGDIENHVTGHGTHVAASALGRGTQSSGRYRGSAPSADLIFLKIADDVYGSASYDVINTAMREAVDEHGADIITMSYGGWDRYHDGTSTIDQSVDYAVSQGATVFISAGNDANDGTHFSGSVQNNDETDFIQVNITGGLGNNTDLSYYLVWYDGLGTHNDLVLRYYDDSQTLITSTIVQSQAESSRGTESELSYANPYLGNGTYYLKVENFSSSTQFFHIYYDGRWNRTGAGTVTFQNPDPFYTLGAPATADSAIAVGAHVTRTEWTDYLGDSHSTSQSNNDIATFSSRGPRVDGIQKISLTAPGSVIISARDTDVYPLTDVDIRDYIIDNDGISGGPADYFVMHGTSMSTPITAGAAALLLSYDPLLTPPQIRNILFNNTTSDIYTGSVPNNTWGYGKLNIAQALESLLSGNIYGQYVVLAGNYSFGNTDIDMNFSTSTDSGMVSVAEIMSEPPGGQYNVTGSLHHVSSIRFWKINTVKSGFNSSVTFSYDPLMDVIGDESLLRLARRNDSADPWEEYSDITRNPESDQITANNVTAFSQWAFASYGMDNALPVELAHFSGYETDGRVILQWITESEIENAGFNIYRSEIDPKSKTSAHEVIKINVKIIHGAGSSSERHSYYYTDNTVIMNKTYWYILENNDYHGKVYRSDPIKVKTTLIENYQLRDNYPNPFNNSTTIRYVVPKNEEVQLVIYNLLGEKVWAYKSNHEPGYYSMVWNGKNQNGQEVSSGVYYYQLKARNISIIKKLILVR